MRNFRSLPITIASFFLAASCTAQLNISAAQGLIKRLLPKHTGYFIVQALPISHGKDAFEVESANGKIILRGNTGVAVSSALYWYLNEYCHCQVTWNGTNLNLPQTLPMLPVKVHKNTPYLYRYYLNYCTFNYSMAWWDWQRWEKEIDWMALHGINMPLGITGEEYTWYTVYKEMGFTNEDLKGFFSGPSYFAWFWMGNLDAWGGPLPLSWMERQKALQQKIVQRERELGMKPVLPAFTGHVPAAFASRFPNAKLKNTNWKNGFADTYILDAGDPMFQELGRRFLVAQTKLYGTDHLYSADTFNENEPPTDDTAFLAGLSERIYQGMKNADSQATWVMQGWLFYSDRKFWKAPQIKALLDAVPNDHMILLDLAAEIEPVWKRTASFYGKPWIWNMLHNFGGNISMFGRITEAASGPANAYHDPASGKMQGIGLTMEGIEQNPVLYELMTHNTWQDTAIALDSWLNSYIRNRYGKADEHAAKAWQVLKNTVYNGQAIRDGAESIITGRPTFDSSTVWTRTKLNYAPAELLPAWTEFIKAIPGCGKADGFRYDLVDVSRQVLANYALPLQANWVHAYRTKNTTEFTVYSKQFMELIDDMDRLLATRKDFLLGPWIADARSLGNTAAEKQLYEQNARDLVTLWGDENSPLHEYSCRQWSGLLSDFYKPRWQKFFNEVTASLQNNKEMDTQSFEQSIRAWEWQWVISQKTFPVLPSGDPLLVVQELYRKYAALITNSYTAR